MAAVQVAKGLYMGGHEALLHSAELGITHVLSVTNYDPEPPDGACHWHICLEDDERADLLAALPMAVTWLERALRQRGARVLVHCHAGVSRSAAVIAATIMRAKRLDADAAMQALRVRAPGAMPNAGFLAQLQLWGDMGWDLDTAHPGYKQHQLDMVARQYEEQGYVDPDSFAQIPVAVEELAKLVCYRCRKCRRIVATQSQLVPQAGVGRRTFRRTPHGSQQQQQQQQEEQQQQQQQQEEQQQQQQHPSPCPSPSGEAGSLFTEPIDWMAEQVVGPVAGKLYCPGCTARLGSFSWAGISNEAGGWVIPAFQLHIGRLDVQQPRSRSGSGAVQLAGLRLPALLAPHRTQAAAAAAAVEGCAITATDLELSEESAGVEQQQQQQQQQGALCDFLPDFPSASVEHS